MHYSVRFLQYLMWQRVQTLYLLLTIILQWIGLFLPIGSYSDAERLGQCFSLVFDLATTESIIFSVLITVLAVTAITKFKQRKNQMKLCFFLTFVIIAAYITMLVCVYRFAIEQPIIYKIIVVIVAWRHATNLYN